MGTSLPRRAIVTCTAVVAAASLLLAPATGAPRSGGVAWVDGGMHVVGGPVAAAGRVLVFVSAPNRSTWLEAVDPVNGRVAWKVPSGFSEITAGVTTDPLAHGGIALALVPPAGANDGSVRVEGIDIRTGRVAWRESGPDYVGDAPTECPPPLGESGFCLVVETPTSLALAALDPATGHVLAGIGDVERGMSTMPGIYEATGKPSRFTGVRIPGGARWSRRVSAFFGPGYDPDYGWVFDRFGALQVGSVGKAGSGRTEQLGDTRIVALNEADGRRVWMRRGEFQCGGQLWLRGAYRCQFTGSVTFTGPSTMKPSKHVTATLEGFRPSDGGATWRVRLGGFKDLLLGNVAMKDDHHLVVVDPRGARRVVDLRSGAVRAPAAGETFWCARFNSFMTRPPKGTDAFRVGTSYFFPCDANRRPANGFSKPPSRAAATVGDMVVWAAPGGLTGARLRP